MAELPGIRHLRRAELLLAADEVPPEKSLLDALLAIRVGLTFLPGWPPPVAAAARALSRSAWRDPDAAVAAATADAAVVERLRAELAALLVEVDGGSRP